jgi:CBS domain-containing protein
MRTVRQLLDGKKPGVITIDAAEPVRAAIQLMADYFIGALPVLEGGRLAGIVSERDYARKVVLMGRLSKDTPVREIMEEQLIRVPTTLGVQDCMALMTQQRSRHLLAVDGDCIAGVVSIGDVVKAVIDDHEFTIAQLEKYITG